jgi:hypothetical protein
MTSQASRLQHLPASRHAMGSPETSARKKKGWPKEKKPPNCASVWSVFPAAGQWDLRSFAAADELAEDLNRV